MKPEIVWLPADAELPIGVKKTIASEKRTLIVFWGIHGIAHYCWLRKDNAFDLPFFSEEVPSRLVQKMQPKSKKTRKPLTFIHMDNARVHMARETQGKLDASRFKCTPQPPYSPDIAPSDFFFLVG
jgi:histone-lysine N-methyltransferase SETMAR